MERHRKHRASLHLLLRQTKAVTSDKHQRHTSMTRQSRLHRNLAGLPTHVLHRSKATHICGCWYLPL
jgi:hypothetical protein